jgi:hypothetical protein
VLAFRTVFEWRVYREVYIAVFLPRPVCSVVVHNCFCLHPSQRGIFSCLFFPILSPLLSCVVQPPFRNRVRSFGFRILASAPPSLALRELIRYQLCCPRILTTAKMQPGNSPQTQGPDIAVSEISRLQPAHDSSARDIHLFVSFAIIQGITLQSGISCPPRPASPSLFRTTRRAFAPAPFP